MIRTNRFLYAVLAVVALSLMALNIAAAPTTKSTKSAHAVISVSRAGPMSSSQQIAVKLITNSHKASIGTTAYTNNGTGFDAINASPVRSDGDATRRHIANAPDEQYNTYLRIRNAITAASYSQPLRL